MSEDELEIAIIKYGIIFCIAIGICYTAYKIALLFA